MKQPIHHIINSSRTNAFEAIKQCIENGGDADWRTKEDSHSGISQKGDNALITLALRAKKFQNQGIDIAQLLLINGADVNAKTDDSSALSIAIFYRHYNLAKFFIDNGAIVRSGLCSNYNKHCWNS